MKTKIDDQIYLIDDDDAELIEDESNSLQDYQEPAQKITQDLLKTIDIISKHNIKKQECNRTVKGIIVGCEDESLGKYKVQYQDGTWTAYAKDMMEGLYQLGTSVYVTIPNSDMKEDKIILGSTKSTEQSGILLKNELDDFISNGYNLLKTNSGSEQYYLWSDYPEEQVLYQQNSNNNIITFESATFNEEKENIDRLLLQANIQTMLPPSRQHQGNYGIIIDIQFKSNQNNQKTVTRSYILDVDNMVGDPYNFISPITQKILFEIDGKNFIKIKKISLFVKDFIDPPASSKDNNYNIIISNLSLMSGRVVTNEERNGVLLTLNAKKGFVFGTDSNENDTREIQATVKVQMKQVNLKTQKLPFYWFIQNVKITSHSNNYCKYGGQGWKCLNKISQNTNSNEKNFLPENNTFTVKCSDIYTTKTKYKCVVIYNGVAYSKEFEIKKLNADYEIQIISDSGFDFNYDSGNPILQCVVTPKNSNNLPMNFKYVWGSINKFGNFTSLIEETNIYQVDISKITGFTTFKCSVFADNESEDYIGTAQVLITNKLQGDIDYSVVINNGTQLFLYNEEGLSPFETELEDPMPIPALTFTIYDNKGNPLDKNALNQVEVKWIVPINNTMLEINDRQFNSEDIQTSLDNEQKIYKNVNTFSYTIAKKYNVLNNQNDITLKVNYNGMLLTTKTNFTFLKQGDPGTNGTEYQVKIVPNTEDDMSNITPIIYYNNSGVMIPNWNIPEGSTEGWFKVQIWKDSQKFYESNKSDSNKNITITWSILNNYGLEPSYFKYKETNYNDNEVENLINLGILALDKENNYWRDDNIIGNNVLSPANILQAKVEIGDGNQRLVNYATFPIITVKMTFDNNDIYNSLPYHVFLEKNSGFSFVKYKNDGTNPSYSNSKPFKITIYPRQGQSYSKKEVDSYNNSVWYTRNSYRDRPKYSNEYINYRNVYTYTYHDNGENGKWEETNNYISNEIFPPNLQLNSIPSAKNELYLKPSDKYDGLIKTNEVDYQITLNNNLIYIHIPIHFLLNRYFHADLNDWDGNSIDLGNDQKDIILTPQIGAGQKENDNSFTGLIMGKIQKPQQQEGVDKFPIQKIGLFGYKEGKQTVAIDAQTGKTILGKSDGGQIEIDPSQNGAALIKSGNFNPSNGTGMLINFSQGSGEIKNQSNETIYTTTGPEIKFGSGNFSVNKDGYLIAKGGGSIAGWEISNWNLMSNNKKTGISSQSEVGSSLKVKNFVIPNFKYNYMFNWVKGGSCLDSSTLSNTPGYRGFHNDSTGAPKGENNKYYIASFSAPLKLSNRSIISRDYPIEIKLVKNIFQIGDPSSLTSDLIEGDVDKIPTSYYESFLGDYINRIKIESFIFFTKNKDGTGTKIAIDSSIRERTLNKNGTGTLNNNNIIYSEEDINSYISSKNSYAMNHFNKTIDQANQLGLYFNISLFFDEGQNEQDELLPENDPSRIGRDIFIANGKNYITDSNFSNSDGITMFPENTLLSQYVGEGETLLEGKNKAIAFWAEEGEDSREKNEFYISHDGYLKITAANIGGGTNSIYIGRSPLQNQPGDYVSAIYSNAKFQKNCNRKGFYLGQNGFSVGSTFSYTNNKTVSNFQIDEDGTFFVKKGFIGTKENGWIIDNEKIYNKASGFEGQGFFISSKDGISIMYQGTDTDNNPVKRYFSVNSIGELKTSQSAEIGEWQINKPEKSVLTDPLNNNETIIWKSQIMSAHFDTENNKSSYPNLGQGHYYSSNNGSSVTIKASEGRNEFNNPTNICLQYGGIRIADHFLVKNGNLYTKGIIFADSIQSPLAEVGGWTINQTQISNTNVLIEGNGNIQNCQVLILGNHNNYAEIQFKKQKTIKVFLNSEGNIGFKGTLWGQNSNGENKVTISGSSGSISAESFYINGFGDIKTILNDRYNDINSLQSQINSLQSQINDLYSRL